MDGVFQHGTPDTTLNSTRSVRQIGSTYVGMCCQQI